jgi:hypothetical protein
MTAREVRAKQEVGVGVGIGIGIEGVGRAEELIDHKGHEGHEGKQSKKKAPLTDEPGQRAQECAVSGRASMIKTTGGVPDRYQEQQRCGTSHEYAARSSGQRIDTDADSDPDPDQSSLAENSALTGGTPMTKSSSFVSFVSFVLKALSALLANRRLEPRSTPPAQCPRVRRRSPARSPDSVPASVRRFAGSSPCGGRSR